MPRKGPIQLDLFEPVHREFEYKAVMTNKRVGVTAVLQFHNGIGSQEPTTQELKSPGAFDYIPTRRNFGWLQLHCELPPRQDRDTARDERTWTQFRLDNTGCFPATTAQGNSTQWRSAAGQVLRPSAPSRPPTLCPEVESLMPRARWFLRLRFATMD